MSPDTLSGTLSADARKGAKPAKDAAQPRRATRTSVEDDENLGAGLVEHGVGLGRHRVENGPVPDEGTVVLVAPERGEQ